MRALKALSALKRGGFNSETSSSSRLNKKTEAIEPSTVMIGLLQAPDSLKFLAQLAKASFSA